MCSTVTDIRISSLGTMLKFLPLSSSTSLPLYCCARLLCSGGLHSQLICWIVFFYHTGSSVKSLLTALTIFQSFKSAIQYHLGYSTPVPTMLICNCDVSSLYRGVIRNLTITGYIYNTLDVLFPHYLLAVILLLHPCHLHRHSK